LIEMSSGDIEKLSPIDIDIGCRRSNSDISDNQY